MALLHFDGADGSTTITDEKGIAAWSAGGTAALTTDEKVFGSASLELDGAGWVVAPFVSVFNIADSDFCAEGRLTLHAYPAAIRTLFSWNANTGTYAQARLDLFPDGRLRLLVSDRNNHWYASDDLTTAGGNVPLNTPTMVRWGRESGVLFVEIGGTTVVSYNGAYTLFSYGGDMLIGGLKNPAPSLLSACVWDEIRLSVGRSEKGAPVPGSPYPAMPNVTQDLQFSTSSSDWALSSGNRIAAVTGTTSAAWYKARCAVPKASGKWYAEFIVDVVASSDWAIGVAIQDTSTSSGQGGSLNAGDGGRYQYFSSNGKKRKDGVYEDYGTSYTAGDVIGVGFDGDADTVTLYKNGVSQGVMYSGLSGSFELHICKYGPGGQIRIPRTVQFLPAGFNVWAA
ncbi:SPRY domain-containing protein [Pseudomonas citronellolis]|uniref:SPRY domain-containing protein n=1 Tax=Pseudomonas citronellolis TaxID=53408 RepID=UPI00209EC301|nr:hypothetical protein [Pseudomonas citronellolis]MCP1657175.1 hypothetical protein [Pseudomonas citronellolis]